MMEGGFMNNYMKIKDMPEGLRPYEKCIKYGTSALSNEELLAIIIRTGTNGENSFMLASRVLSLKSSNGCITSLMHLSLNELMQIKGIGKVKAIQIKCICELSKRIAMTAASNEIDFSKPATIANYYMESFRHQEVEQLVAIYLDTKCKKIGDKILFSGTVNRSLISPREIFIEALKHNAVNIIILHNHPSGDATPSSDDIKSTKRIMDAGRLIGISLIDHIIIGDRKYTSLKETGIL